MGLIIIELLFNIYKKLKFLIDLIFLNIKIG